MNGVVDVARVFLRLGLIGFGGPAAHVALMRDEIVVRRRWLDDREFLDLVAAVNLIPGPNSTELAIHIGYRRAGWPGLVVAGLCFILPAFLIVLACAVLYVRHGTTPQAAWLMYGISPVVVAIVLDAVWQLSRNASQRRWWSAAVIGAAALAALAGLHELVVIFGTGALFVVGCVAHRARAATALVLAFLAATSAVVAAAVTSSAPSVERLWWFFLKVGSVLFGSGYVLIAFLRADLVERWGWLTDRQLLDAVAIGQLTPGPLSTTATFIGYCLGGWPGAVVSTVGIFLPAFVFVALSSPFVPRLRASRPLAALLDGMTLASIGLMLAVVVGLFRQAIGDATAATLLVASLIALAMRRVHPTWLVAVGAATGWFLGR